MKKSIFSNYLYNISYQILVMILPLVTTPYVSRVLGAANIGAYSYTQSITYYFILFGSMGLNLYGQREVAYVQDDREKRSKIFWEIVFMRMITHGVSIAFFCTTLVQYEKYQILYAIQIVDIVASCLDVSWFFQGMEDFRRLAIRNILVRLGAVLCIFLFVNGPDDLCIYAICYSAALLIGNIFMFVGMPNIICKISPKELELKKHLKPSITLFLPQIATSIYNVLDRTMIGTITQLEEEVAYYEQAQKIVKVAMSFLTSIGTVMLPRIAYVFSKNEHNEIQRYITNTFRLAFFCGVPLTLGMMAVASGMVPWFYGQGFDKVAPNIQIIAPVILIVGLSNVIGVQYLLPTGRQKDYLISVLVGSGTNVVFNLLFIPQLYSVGAALASVIAETVVLIIQVVRTRKDFRYGAIIKRVYKYIIAGAIMCFVLRIFVYEYPPTISLTVMQGIIGGIVYIGSLIMLKDEMLIEVCSKIRRNRHV